MKTEEIDKKIGMPDIEQEWRRFEREVIDAPRIGVSQSRSSSSPRSMHRVAAIAVVMCIVGGLALAAVFYMLPSAADKAQPRPIQTDVEAQRAELPALTVDADESLASWDETEQAYVFDNVEMQAIVGYLATAYNVEPVFVSNEARHVRLYVTIPATKSLDEIVSLLNNLQHVEMQLADGKLIIR